jgi:phage I-like protein
MNHALLLDAPGTPTRQIQIARLGPVSDERYGDFSITRANAKNWAKNLSRLPGGRALCDFEHRSEKRPRDSQAAGWITGINLDGDRVMADIEWTPRGRKAVSSKRYLFVSPAFGPYRTEDGAEHDDCLVSVALTNKPKLDSLPALTLAAPERLEAATSALKLLDASPAERDRAHAAGHSLKDGSYPINDAGQLHAAAVLAASGHGKTKAAKKLIKRRARELGVPLGSLPGFGGKDTTQADAAQTLPRMLDLPDDAPDAQVFKAVRRLKTRKGLKTLAAERGLVVLDQRQVRRLEQRAAKRAVRKLEKEVADQQFDHVFTLALNDPRGARVTPGEREQLRHVYTLDSDAALRMIEERQPLVSARPAGEPALDLTVEPDVDPDELVRAGVYPGNHELDQKIRAHLRELGKPMSEYPVVLDQISSGALTL